MLGRYTFTFFCDWAQRPTRERFWDSGIASSSDANGTSDTLHPVTSFQRMALLYGSCLKGAVALMCLSNEMHTMGSLGHPPDWVHTALGPLWLYALLAVLRRHLLLSKYATCTGAPQVCELWMPNQAYITLLQDSQCCAAGELVECITVHPARAHRSPTMHRPAAHHLSLKLPGNSGSLCHALRAHALRIAILAIAGRRHVPGLAARQVRRALGVSAGQLATASALHFGYLGLSRQRRRCEVVASRKVLHAYLLQCALHRICMHVMP